MASVELQRVSKVFKSRGREPVRALDEFTLDVADGELLALVGPSGSGKSTLLRLISGLEVPTSGTILFDRALAEPRADRRDAAMVFQSDALMPHLTVRENIAIGLKLRHLPPTDIDNEVATASDLVGLTQLLDRLPEQLSGGERQRVALARALVRRPKVFLFDEPLSSLDAPSRWRMRSLISRIHRQTETTTIYVTHDQHDALALGQRIAVVREGALQQVADPVTLYQVPANAFVAGFVGSPPMNLFRGHVRREGGHYRFAEHNVTGAANGTRLEVMLEGQRADRLAAFAKGNLLLGVRAEHVHVGSEDNCHVRAIIECAEYLGPEVILHCTTGASKVCVRVPAERVYATGDRVPLRLDVGKALFFNPVSERVIA